MKAFCTLILVLMAGTAYGQSDLRTCSEFEIWFWGGNDCFGTRTYPSGERFTGRYGIKIFLNGIYFWPNGDKYEGNFEPINFSGTMVNGTPGGEGVFIKAIGDRIESKDFQTQRKKQFQGQITYANGNKYVGQLISERIFTGEKEALKSFYLFHPDGKGIYTYINGDIYDGNFVKGIRDGEGRFLLANGEIYQGIWRKNELWGLGSNIRVDGESFEGDFVKGTLNASGIWKKNGKKFYEGNFQNGLPDGFGKEYDKDEKVVYEGQWVHGKRVVIVEKNISPQSTSTVNNSQVIQSIDISAAKSKCEELGFKLATEGFGKCVLQLTK